MPKLAPKNQCTGCTACYASCPKNCITMQQDKYGFVYPVIDTVTCVNCKKCELVCPVVMENKQASKRIPTVYAAYALDTNIRMESSSGGIFSIIANEIIRKNGVVFGAVYDSQYKVKHVCIENKVKLSALRGAKYSQSDLNSCFKDVKHRLDIGQKVMFVGMPCQISGLKSYLKKSYQNLFTVDFVCYGVPSPLVWKKYVQYRADKDNGGIMPTSINLRSKKTGWSKYHYSNEYSYGNGKVYSALSGEDLFMRLFVGAYINRESCTNCHCKGYKRVSDITLGDFWGIWDVAPEMDDDKGTSLVLVHSDNACDIIKCISDKMIFKELNIRQASARNTSILVSSPAANDRMQVLEKCINGEFDEIELFLNSKDTKQFSGRRFLNRFFGRIRKMIALMKN